jgi:hypothetical protein
MKSPLLYGRPNAVNPSRAKLDLTCAILSVFLAMLPIAAVAIAWGLV